MNLCGQIRKILGACLTGVARDDILAGLEVTRVDPDPDGSRLLVTVVPLPDRPRPEAAMVTGRLAAEATRLRREVAAAIHRRRTPELQFRLGQAGEVGS